MLDCDQVTMGGEWVGAGTRREDEPMPNPQPGDRDPEREPTPAEEADDPSNPKQRTGEAQAAANREDDPPA